MCVYVWTQEHKLLRNQSMAGPKLPDLSEVAEQEKGNSPIFPFSVCKIASSLSSTCSNVTKGVHFLILKENLFQSANDDDLFLFAFSHCATRLLVTS